MRRPHALFETGIVGHEFDVGIFGERHQFRIDTAKLGFGQNPRAAGLLVDHHLERKAKDERRKIVRVNPGAAFLKIARRRGFEIENDVFHVTLAINASRTSAM